MAPASILGNPTETGALTYTATSSSPSMPYVGDFFPTPPSRFKRFIHSVKRAFLALLGHNPKQVIQVTPEQFRRMQILPSMNKNCLVCGLPFRLGYGQQALYHSYCRKFRKNKHGFDINKVDI